MVTEGTSEQARELQRQYLREWRRKNPAKLRQYNKAYWERRAQKLQAAEKGDSDAKTDV